MTPFVLILKALNWLLDIAQYAIFISVLMSWIPQSKGTKFANILSMLTEPILEPIRQMINKALAGKNIPIDISPIVAILLIGIVQSFIKQLIR